RPSLHAGPPGVRPPPGGGAALPFARCRGTSSPATLHRHRPPLVQGAVPKPGAGDSPFTPAAPLRQGGIAGDRLIWSAPEEPGGTSSMARSDKRSPRVGRTLVTALTRGVSSHA